MNEKWAESTKIDEGFDEGSSKLTRKAFLLLLVLTKYLLCHPAESLNLSQLVLVHKSARQGNSGNLLTTFIAPISRWVEEDLE